LSTRSFSSLTFMLSAEMRASLRTFLGTVKAYVLGVGPKIVPPPLQRGERIVPTRARPVPFWRQGFLPPPLISLRSLVSWVPCRFAAICIRTTS